MKQRLGILLMMVLFIISLVSCKDNNEPTSKGKNTNTTAGSTANGTTTDTSDGSQRHHLPPLKRQRKGEQI